MNPSPLLPGRATRPTVTAAGLEALEAAYARRIAGRLSEGQEDLSPLVSERLRFGRTQALLRAREARRARLQPTSPLLVTGGGVAALGGHLGRTGWRLFAALVPVLLILGGLWAIDEYQSRQRLRAAADIDAQLLTDVLPPTAYADPGFKAFLAREPLAALPHDEAAPADETDGELQ